MPSSKKKNLKDIYVASSMEELNKIAEVATKATNPTVLCKSADRIYTTALSHDDSNDEEKAYIFYLRYVSVITQIRKTNQYKKEKAHFDKMIGTTKPMKAITLAEKLQNSLMKRYEERRKLKEDEELAKKVLAKKNDEEKKPKEASKQDKMSSDDDLLDGNAISSSVDLYQRLKVNHTSILTPKGSISNGLHNDSDALIPGMTSTIPCLTAEQLYSIMKTSSPIDFLILDIRSQKDYAKNHILHESSINIPAEFLEHGVSVSNIERRLQERTRVVWRERARKQHIIIVDKSTKVTEVSPSSKLFQFKEAIYKNDSSCQLMNEPLFLDGGFEGWLWHYPSMATKPELPVISSNTSLDKMIDVSALDFPELPTETKPPPMESKPQPPTPSTIPSPDVNNVYPSLPTSLQTSKPTPHQHGQTNGGEFTTNQSPIHSHTQEAERKPDSLSNHRPPPKIPDTGHIPQSPVPANQPSSQKYHGSLDQTTPRPHTTIPGIEAGKSGTMQPKLPIDKAMLNQVPGNQVPGNQQQPTVMPQGYQPSVIQQPGVPAQPMPGQIPTPSKIPGQIPNQQPSSNQSQIPGHPTNTNNQVPGQSPASSTHSSLPGQTQTPTSNNQVPQHRVDHRPVQPPSSNQNQLPGNVSSVQAVGPKPGHPPIYGQTVNPSQQTPQNVIKPATNQGGAKPAVTPSEIKHSGYMTTKGLPPGWERCIDGSNRVFYKDHNTQTTHWSLPSTTTVPATQPQPQNIPTKKENIPTTPQNTPKQQFPRQLGTTPGQTNKLKSNLRRSLSSPNLANLDDDADDVQVKIDPVINRSLKPAAQPNFNRNAKPLTTQKIDSLNPVRGGVGRGLTGLRNLGNTCYMNSVLQCLFSAAPLAQYFISGAFRDDLNTKNPMGTRGELAEQFSILVRVANSGQYKSLSPVEFKKTVGRAKSTFSGFDQQDSQEFLALMMDKLHEDVNMVLKKPYLEAPGDDVEPSKAAEISWANHKKRNRSIMLELFDGLFMSTVKCLVCGKKSVTFETFSNLTLPIPGNTNHCSLKDCINLFTRPEKMSGDDKWYCPQCKQHREASKQLQIWKLPPILVIHLKRFQYDGMWRQKLQTNISFPLVDLDMSGYAMGPKSQPPYSLYGVSNHYGTMHGGHYTAFCRNPHNKRWYKFDDQLVSEISSSNSVVTSAGYLLFYTSIPFQPPKLF